MKLKEIRESKNLTQSELADSVGVTQGVVSMWEIGLCKPALDNIKKIAAALGVTVDELLADPEEK